MEDIWVEATVVDDDATTIRKNLEEINKLNKKLHSNRILLLVNSIILIACLFVIYRLGAAYDFLDKKYTQYTESYNDDTLYDAWVDGHDNGVDEVYYDQYDAGYEYGYDKGYNEALKQNSDRSYNLGYNAGYQSGMNAAKMGVSSDYHGVSQENKAEKARQEAEEAAANITMSPVESSFIDSVGYEPSVNLLRISFLTGGTYDYFDVPGYTYADFMKADSKGSYFNDKIKHVFIYEKIAD